MSWQKLFENPITPAEIRLTVAQRAALELIDAAAGGYVRGNIATSTRRWLVARGLIEGMPSHITDAGRIALGYGSGIRR